VAETAPAAEPKRQQPERKELGAWLLLLSARLYRLQAETVEALGVPLSFQQFRILQRVERGVTSLTALADLAKRRPSTISKSVDSLVRQGLLTREPAPSDRRTMVLTLTTPGVAILRQGQGALENLASWLVEDVEMNHSELRELLEYLYEKAEPRIKSDAADPGSASEG
jgi:MarR family transcriptional regulator, organic hydroperoxide resistance regulator